MQKSLMLKYFILLIGMTLSTMFVVNANPAYITQTTKAISFTQIKDKEHIKTLLPIFETSFKSGFAIYQISPLQAKISLVQNNNQLTVTVDIINPNNYEWFVNKWDDLNFYLLGRKKIYNFTNSDFMTNHEVEVSYIFSDNDFFLIRPNETLTFQRTIPAEEIYQNWYDQDIFVKYFVSGTPVTILNEFLELYEDQKTEGVYYDDLKSNQIRFRCINYDQDTKQYQFDIDQDDHTEYWEIQ